jgi:hypothetical protein
MKAGKQSGIALIIFLLLCSTVSMAGARKPEGQSAAATPAAASTAAPQPPAGQNNDELIAGLKQDLTRMEVLVQQMEVNLAHVEPGQTFLKHQFQLEIDAWKVMIVSMRRRVQAMEKNRH